MATRTWLAVALSCLVWFVYMRWFAPPLPPPPNPATSAPSSAQTPQSSPGLSQGSGVPTPGSVPTSVFATKPAVRETARLSSPARDVVLSDAGGKITAVHINDYTQTLKKDSPKILSVDPATMPFTFGTLFTDPVLAELNYGTYATQSKDGVVTFEKAAQGVRVTKTISAGEGDYFLDQKIRIQFPDSDRRDWGALLVPVGGQGMTYHVDRPLEAWSAVAYQNDAVTRKTLDDINSGQEVMQGATKWIAFGNYYFASGVVNDSPINPDIVFEKGGDFTGVFLRFPLSVKEGTKELSFRVKLFSGPKDYTELSRVPGMRQLIDYGMFSFLAYPLLDLLRFFNRFVNNYGWSILILALFVRILFYPLSVKSYRSMKAMQKLQPQLAALKEKYKDDAQRFGQEQMALFREHKVNPMGGCLPLLVQLPVFIALYAVLQSSIELYHAPFIWWIQDLSAKDPYYVFPILMGVAMFVQQKMTPAAGMGPMQQKILLLMPIIFTVLTLNLPSGLTIYIFVSTLLGILQQVLMNREQGTKGGLVPAPQPTQGK